MQILETTKERIKLKVGHIGAAGALSYEDKMLNISLEDIYENGIIDERIRIELAVSFKSFKNII